ncbi:aspartic peptidase domain-containing protein [Cantharellus anzutake]|uniref:aspartic peptidase domain-containing protein n=1 Tax=Cantharellus anzutake TaxID=1750568 RepID=UPI001908C819|nr:aspartic peptidase domain-containing protein [Cantharellus anzutake]KAF8340668.1 aspartic peptidase domain-containing protein [Cantharellus anzutake]
MKFANCTGTTIGKNEGNATGFPQGNLAAAQDGGLTKSHVVTSNGTTGLDIIANDVGYVSTIQIGTVVPAVSLPVVDTDVVIGSGSADTWVGATNCKNDQSGQPCSAKHVTLGTRTSSSLANTGKTFQVTYGAGAVAGLIITDNIVFAGLPLDNHTFGVSTIETVEFSADNIPFDGLVGLAQSTLSNQRVLTPVESLAEQGSISAAIASFKIPRLADQKNDGQVTFGGLPQGLFDPTTLVTVNNVNQRGFWESAVDAFTVNGQDTGLSERTAIMDTGTTLIIAPAADAAAIHAVIPGAQKADQLGQGLFTLPCTTNVSVALTLGVNQNDLTGDCVSGISAGTVGGSQEWLVGDVFLKNVMFSTDVGKNTLSFAKLV